ncbi:ABC transporter ATP-binding protein [Halalkalibacter urbisdiaboli]|uniref:ABC transporter ATP-binding protein n=1 Tax=Halalkalibacter urbisdiaboli TaxID=1960589 RepID=UPI000B44FE00|nr:dipeptide/oligopeptide/nickel ABC transporter ATP-binding protein [Halalkalibacter urbisdiaboli]
MDVLLDVRNVQKKYGKDVIAVHNFSFQLKKGTCLGIVGESGSGKSTLAKLILVIEKPTHGEIHFQQKRIDRLKGEPWRQLRKSMQLVFQDPTASLNQRVKIMDAVMEPLDNFKEVTPAFLKEVRHSRRAAATKLLNMVGLSSSYLNCYPHELSGGQKQRVVIARAISLGPELLICDEPTSSLDVSIQAQILNLLKELKETLRMSYLFISHDIGAVAFMSDEMMVMKDGQLIEQFPQAELATMERNIYTKKLIEASM